MRRVILDVDTGHDDAMAILFCSACISLEAITVVAGNQVLGKTLMNTVKVCSLAGIDVPIMGATL